ncbi:MAG: DEAD/DEAH box helicase family protein [Coriobacteriales bacterium]|jgi:superfamily II DNA or RNA helicase|nr:DEAD/DEAH box helicase family protein [Coriobacteriales bacterium]
MINNCDQEKHELSFKIDALYCDRDAIGRQISALEKQLTLIDTNQVQTDFQAAGAHADKYTPEMWPADSPAAQPPSVYGRLVTRQSSPEDKYELFIHLFAGRPDVHALRWTHGDGYSPECANSFAKFICKRRKDVPGTANCTKCEHRQFTSLSIDAFKAHTNTTATGRTIVLGAYPLNSKDNCKFIVADFDGKPSQTTQTKKKSHQRDDDHDAPRKALLTAVSFRTTCNAAHVPVSLEISRSGKGYHIWLFFSSWVPGSKARRLFTALWTKTMEENPGLDFSVYDRFIPCQDTVSSKGLQGGTGNLVALPFQGQVGNLRRSVFLDDSLRPYPDQWEYLSTVELMSAEALEKALQRICPSSDIGDLLLDEPDEDTNNPRRNPRRPWEKRKPEVALKKSDAEPLVTIVCANMLYIKKSGLSSRAMNRIKRLAAFRNKEFYRKQNMRLSTYDEPRVISVAQETADYLLLPRGAESSLIELLVQSDIGYATTDERTRGIPLDVEFTGKLTAEQSQAAEKLLNYDLGVLSAATGFGKTVIGASLIASRATNTLILVHRNDLYDQWKVELSKFLHIKNVAPDRITPSGRRKKQDAIGEYGGTTRRRSGLVDVAMIQSLYCAGSPPDFIKEYGMILVDEAHHATAASFEAVLQYANAWYVYGLTATPSRKDGRQPILFLECGPVRFKTDAKEQAKKRPFEHYVVPRFTGFQRTSVNDDTNWASVASALIASEDRNQMIIDDVVSALESGRNPMVLSERKEHVLRLVEMLNPVCENVITMIGGRSTKERREASERLRALSEGQPFVIVGTGQLVGEGFDYPRLDTLFIAMPISWKGKVAQYIGRLHRIYEGKEDVRIYDYIDAGIAMLGTMYHKRLAAYKANGYSILPNLDSDANDTVASIIFSKDDYWDAFWKDCLQAQNELVIASPRIVKYRAERLISLPQIAQKELAITIYTQGNKRDVDETTALLVARFEDSGCRVVCRPEARQCLAIIDQETIWYGSINLLGHATKRDTMIRVVDAAAAKALLRVPCPWLG